jgi:hypothetical protein
MPRDITSQYSLKSIIKDYENIMNTPINQNGKETIRNLHNNVKNREASHNWLSRKIRYIRDVLSSKTSQQSESTIKPNNITRSTVEHQLHQLCSRIDNLRKDLESPTGKKQEISDLKKLQKIIRNQHKIANELWSNEYDANPKSVKNVVKTLDGAIDRSIKLRELREKAAGFLWRLDPVCILAANKSELSKMFRKYLIKCAAREPNFALDKHNIEHRYAEFVKSIVSKDITDSEDILAAKDFGICAKDKDIQYFTILKKLQGTIFLGLNVFYKSNKIIQDTNAAIQNKIKPA